MKKLVVLMSILLLGGTFYAQGVDKKAETATAFINKGMGYFQAAKTDADITAALMKINQKDGEFASTVYSIFVIDFNGVTHANSTFPEFVGKNFIALKDPDGVEFVKLYITNAKSPKGEGWCEYKFLLADKKTTGVKQAYIKKLPQKINGIEAFIGCAFEK